jgi:hypothetical protein
MAPPINPVKQIDPQPGTSITSLKLVGIQIRLTMGFWKKINFFFSTLEFTDLKFKEI